MTVSVGYIRQSRRADLDVALSYDAQLAAIRRMAGKDVEIVSDMGRSGKGGGERLRPQYQRLVERVRAGEVGAVYVISLSRLSRSVPELHDFMDLAQSTGCAIVSDKEGKLDPSTASGKLMFNIWAAFAEYVRDLQVEAAYENVAVRRARGDTMGQPRYGDREGQDAGVVVRAFRKAGSYNGAATMLNANGVPSARGRTWSSTAVRNVVARDGTAVPRNPKRGVKPSSGFLLYRLLQCPCGGTLTASRDGRGDRDVVYRCHRAEGNPQHPRPYRIQETAVLPWVMAEVARLQAPETVSEKERTSDRAALEARKARILDNHESGHLTDDERDARLAPVYAELEKLDDETAAAAILTLPAIDWSRHPGKKINAVLRIMFKRIELGGDMLPVKAEWLIPEWRAAG